MCSEQAELITTINAAQLTGAGKRTAEGEEQEEEGEEGEKRRRRRRVEREENLRKMGNLNL